MKVLLDNDVFFSAVVRSHPSHALSRRWLDKNKKSGWGIASETYLAAVRLLLKATKTGAVAAKTGQLAEALAKSPDEVVATLVAAGLKVPEKAREKPVFVEHAGEIFWLSQNAKGELWVNAKASKFADRKENDGGSGETDAGGKAGRRGGGRSHKKGEGG